MSDSFFSKAVLSNTYSFLASKSEPSFQKPDQPNPRKQYMDKMLKEILSRRQQPQMMRIDLPQPVSQEKKKGRKYGASPGSYTPMDTLPTAQMISPSLTQGKRMAQQTLTPNLSESKSTEIYTTHPKSPIEDPITPERPRKAMKSTKKPKQKRTVTVQKKRVEKGNQSHSQKRGEKKQIETQIGRNLNQKDPSTNKICPICKEAFPGGKMKQKVNHLRECSIKYEELLEQEESESSRLKQIY